MNAKAVSLLLAPVAIVGGYALWPKSHPAQPATVAAETAVFSEGAKAVTLPPTEVVDLMDALSAGNVKADCKGNGRERLWVTLTNKGPAPLAVKVPVGQVFESERNAMVVVRPEGKDLPSGGSVEISLQTAATRSLNKLGEARYRPTYNGVPKIELFLTYIQDHLELSPGAIQTAILALTENLPVSAVAKFTPAGGALPSRFNTNAFRVETFDIIQALSALREMGMKDRDLALTIDPQLKIEAMIEPLCRASAMRYYGIAEETEWEYWRAELLQGDPSTRHYALYGIARFYPEIALEMLPRWVRETKTNAVYRLSAIQALADTQRPEALSLLQTLVDELGAETDLGKAAATAAKYLDSHLAKVAAVQTKVAFRSSSSGLGY
jgi:hypothetical protein